MPPKPRVCIVTPGTAEANNGNWHTAARWQRLLAQGASPSAAGEQAGYQDYSTFSRAYKKQFGHGPSADVGRQHDLP